MRLTNSGPDNAEVLNSLMAQETAPADDIRNVRNIAFIDLKQARTTNESGLGPDGVYRDPWKNPYVITLDLNGDGYCVDAVYSRPIVSAKLLSAKRPIRNEIELVSSDRYGVKTDVMIWSMGPDGKADPNLPADEGVNKDNILSWIDN